MNIIHLLLDVLKFKLDASGFLAAFPYLLMAGIVQSAGILADYARTRGRLSTTFVRAPLKTNVRRADAQILT